MSRHYRLHFAVLTALTAGALLVPAAAAVASDGSGPATGASAVPKESVPDKERLAEKEKAAADQRAKEPADQRTFPKEIATGEIPPEKARQIAAEKARADGVWPRGSVAAGEAPAGSTGTAALAGSAAGTLLLAGAGTFVLRRRSSQRPTA
ncbi:hypothetical protein [Streptomyces paludis]|uniref:LPXTG cell wall anchor domain-containing protein n=1 Tax=Streptomyces paludis TaxID=2282738 RepID=A0A345I172_9ACTN|nr:hypothetical protein [Streptomyces paludis]AXG82696.1 hypothetical protein DVK44_17770 [Streptomyces paludis]